MKYVSLNHNSSPTSFMKAVINGLAPDKGLYYPQEKIALSKYPKLKSIKLYLESLPKQVFVRMTGSGSALVAYFRSKERCVNAKRMFNKKYKNYWCIVSKTI